MGVHDAGPWSPCPKHRRPDAAAGLKNQVARCNRQAGRSVANRQGQAPRLLQPVMLMRWMNMAAVYQRLSRKPQSAASGKRRETRSTQGWYTTNNSPAGKPRRKSFFSATSSRTRRRMAARTARSARARFVWPRTWRCRHRARSPRHRQPHGWLHQPTIRPGRRASRRSRRGSQAARIGRYRQQRCRRRRRRRAGCCRS